MTLILHNIIVPITEKEKKKEISLKQTLINYVFKIIKSSGVKAFLLFNLWKCLE